MFISETTRISLKLIYSSSNTLLRLSFLALPLALLLSVSSYLFVENILNSYERFLVKSYIGIQGRLSIHTNDTRLIQDLRKYAQAQNFSYSLKSELKSILVFKGEQNLPKYTKIVSLDLSYMKQKFNYPQAKKHTLFANEVFLRSLGEIDPHSFTSFSFKNEKIIFSIEKIVPVETGFLSSEPIVFMSQSLSSDVFSKLQKTSQTIEFLQADKHSLKRIKTHTDALALEHSTMQLQIKDLIIDTQDTKDFFQKITRIQSLLTLLIFILALGIILLSLSISIAFKKTSLKTLHLLGISIHELSLSLSYCVFCLSLFIISFSYLMQPYYQDIFANFFHFKHTFFLSSSLSGTVLIFSTSIFLTLFTYFSSKKLFRASL